MRRAMLGVFPSGDSAINHCVPAASGRGWVAASRNAREARLAVADMITVGRAARIMDELENRGIVGPSKGAEPRDILIDLDVENSDHIDM